MQENEAGWFILKFMFTLCLAIGLIAYYSVVIDKFTNDKFRTKKEVQIALIPLGWLFYEAKKRYDKLRD